MCVLCIAILTLCILQLETCSLVPAFRIILILESASSYSGVLMISSTRLIQWLMPIADWHYSRGLGQHPDNK